MVWFCGRCCSNPCECHIGEGQVPSRKKDISFFDYVVIGVGVLVILLIVVLITYIVSYLFFYNIYN